LAVLGKAMECDNFWGRDKIRYTDQGPALLDIGCVILPAYVEHQPRPLLLALASGVPVICSRACGIPEGTPGVALIDAGNEEQLRAHLAHYAPARLS
jgi:glycosyltransferase involved in cell wall biosynthesis